jgi:tellurite resistance protein TerC
VTRDPLIVYTSNVMAMMGLRSIYFVLADTLTHLRFLRQGLAVVLLFTAGKMLASDWIHIGPGLSIFVIALVLLVTVAASVWAPAPRSVAQSAPPAPAPATRPSPAPPNTIV